MTQAGGDHLPSNTVLRVNGVPLAYAHWWQDEQQWIAEIISFVPGDAEPLSYHESPQ